MYLDLINTVAQPQTASGIIPSRNTLSGKENTWGKCNKATEEQARSWWLMHTNNSLLTWETEEGEFLFPNQPRSGGKEKGFQGRRLWGSFIWHKGKQKLFIFQSSSCSSGIDYSHPTPTHLFVDCMARWLPPGVCLGKTLKVHTSWESTQAPGADVSVWRNLHTSADIFWEIMWKSSSVKMA